MKTACYHENTPDNVRPSLYLILLRHFSATFHSLGQYEMHETHFVYNIKNNMNKSFIVITSHHIILFYKLFQYVLVIALFCLNRVVDGK